MIRRIVRAAGAVSLFAAIVVVAAVVPPSWVDRFESWRMR